MRLGALALLAACLAGITVFSPLVERLVPTQGVRRSLYPQIGFQSPPADAVTSEINLAFLDARPELPRQQFSVQWRGVFYLDEPQTVEFFAGGNDEVQLRVDGTLLLTRNIREGMRTIGRSMALAAGAHQLEVDYQQFGGGMSINIQRAIGAAPPSPFVPTELFTESVRPWQVQLLRAARLTRQATLPLWLAAIAFVFIRTAFTRILRESRTSGSARYWREYAARVGSIAVPALLAPCVVFLLGPYTIFSGNPGEFSVPFSQLAWPWLIRAAATNWALLCAAGCLVALLSRTAAQVYAAMVLALGAFAWGQGNLWNADYGVLAGREVDMAEHAGRGPYELAALCLVVLVAVLLARRISRIAAFATLAFLAVQAAAAVVSAERSGAAAVRWIDPPPEIFAFAPKNNVLHIVLDEFQSDVFGEILEQDRAELDRTFSGFTYFADHSAAFPTTSMSMPAMLTGREYRNDRPAPDFARSAFKDESIFATVSRAGYDVDAMSIVPIPSFEEWLGPESAPNWPGARFRIRKPFISQADYREVAARQLLELSQFRHVPHSAKALSIAKPDRFYRTIWMNRGESPSQIRRHEASNSAAFVEQFVERMAVARERPVYKLLHMGVPHRPIVVDRNCRFIGLTDMSRDVYREQSRCAIKLVSDVLTRVRALGIYDSSLIIVSSDHGTDLEPLGFNGNSDSLSLVPGPSTSRLPATVGSAKAVMFIKPPGAAGPVVVSQAPTTHIDLPPTVVDALKLDGRTNGSMLRRDEKEPRTRVYGMYDPRQRFPKGYLDRIDLLAIDGRTIDAAAWHVGRSIWNPNARLERRDVDVGPREAHQYLGPGWSFERRERSGNEDVTFAQAVTPKVVIYATLPASPVRLVLRASTSPGSAPDAISVSIDSQTIATLRSESSVYRDLSLDIPANSSRPTISEITLHLQATAIGVPVFKLDRMSIQAH